MQHVSPAVALKSATALTPMPRSIVGARVRADASNPAVVLAELQKAFDDFKAENDTKLKAKADVVIDEKVERINTAVTTMQTAMDELVLKLAAEKVKPGNLPGDLAPTSPEAVAAFKTFMRRGEEVNAALTKSVDTEGGYLAPVEWDRTITDKLKQISKIRENARVQPITVAGFKKLFSDRNVGSGWVGETATRAATTTPAIGSLDWAPGELYANPAISSGLLQDSAIDLETWLADEVEVEFSRQEGIAFLSGDGTNKPHGVLTYVVGAANAARHPWGAIPVVNSGSAAALTGDGFIDLMYALPSEFTPNAKLYINRTSLGATRKLKDGQGNYLWQMVAV